MVVVVVVVCVVGSGKQQGESILAAARLKLEYKWIQLYLAIKY